MRHCRIRHASLLAAAVTAVWLPAVGQAGVFDDDIAREQIAKTQQELTEFRGQTAGSLERLEAALKMQLELANQIEALRADLSKLRGQLEVLGHAVETGEKRQRDFYLDLDGRLRKLETTVGELQLKAAEPPPAVKPKVDPAVETRQYEDALNLFKAGKYKDAQTAFQNHLRDFPAGPLAASAQFWLANSFYAQRNCKAAVDEHNVVVAKFPDSDKAPDSMLAIATCQQELKDAKGARKTLEQLVTAYPKSPAAEAAKKRLKKK